MIHEYNPLKCPRCGKKDVRWNIKKQLYTCRVCGKKFTFNWNENGTAKELSVAFFALDEIKQYLKEDFETGGMVHECVSERLEEVRELIRRTIELTETSS